MIWKVRGKNVNREGTTITYWGGGTNILVQSRKRLGRATKIKGDGTCR